MATASSISPSGMQLAGKYGIGVLSIASNSTEGIQALPTQWAFAEEAAAEHGSTVDRRDWRVLMAFHLAETREQARARGGARPAPLAQRVQRVDARPARAPWPSRTRGTCSTARPQGGAEGAGAAVVGTPDDLVAAIRHLQRHHRRLRRRARLRPRLGQPRGDVALVGPRRPLRRPRDQRLRPPACGRRQQYLHDNQAELMGGASRAVMAKIMAHDGAAKAMATTMEQMQRSAGRRRLPPGAASRRQRRRRRRRRRRRGRR